MTKLRARPVPLPDGGRIFVIESVDLQHDNHPAAGWIAACLAPVAVVLTQEEDALAFNMDGLPIDPEPFREAIRKAAPMEKP